MKAVVYSHKHSFAKPLSACKPLAHAHNTCTNYFLLTEVQFYCLTRAESSAFLRATPKFVILCVHAYQLKNFSHKVLLSLAVQHEG